MRYRMRVWGLEGTIEVRHAPQAHEASGFIETYDPEAAGGRGYATLTRDPALAMTFDSMADAFEFMRQTPRSRPVRDDGRPNRPLTAFTIEIEPVP